VAGGIGVQSFTVAPESTAGFIAQPPSVTTFAAFGTGRPLWPSDITGLVLWLPADQIQGIASGTSLSAWTDSSASASHATQASAVSQPVYVTNVQNGLGGVSFGQGIGQIMQSPTSIVDTTTLCLVTAPTQVTPTARIVGATGAGNGSVRITTTAGSWALSRGGTLSVTSITLGAWKDVICYADVSAQSVGTITVSGTTFSGSIQTSGVTSLLCSIGAVGGSTSTYSGVIGEIVVYNRNLVEIERSSLDSYFRTKWAI